MYNVLNILRSGPYSPVEESLACDLHDGGLISCHHGGGVGGGGGHPVCPHSYEICSPLESCDHHLAWIWTFLDPQTCLAFDDAHFLCESLS